MRKLSVLLLGLMAAVAPAAAQTSSALPSFLLRANPADAPFIAARHNLTIVNQVTDASGVTMYLVTPVVDNPGLATELNGDLAVMAFERNHVVGIPESIRPRLMQSTAAILEALPDRTIVPYYGRSVWRGYANQPAAVLINTPAVHALPVTGGGVVAIIDTGIDVNHPALVGAFVPGYDFVRQQATVTSDLAGVSQSTAAILEASGLPAAFGHGTMVAGLVRLVAPTARIMPLTAFAPDGSGDVFNVVRAIYYAVDHGANVINMSFSLADWSAELVRAVNYANEHDVICVASAGNNGEETLVFPSAFRHVVGVGSSNNLDLRSTFSNFGNGLVYLAAPGESLITPFPAGRYAAVSGTSFSAALVSGAAALIEQVKPGIEPTNAQEALSCAKRIGQDMGSGRLDLLSALLRALK